VKLLLVTEQDLGNIKGLSEAKVDKLVEAAKKVSPGAMWQSALLIEQQVRLRFHESRRGGGMGSSFVSTLPVEGLSLVLKSWSQLAGVVGWLLLHLCTPPTQSVCCCSMDGWLH
jgi:hypothetical protein